MSDFNIWILSWISEFYLSNLSNLSNLSIYLSGLYIHYIQTMCSLYVAGLHTQTLTTQMDVCSLIHTRAHECVCVCVYVYIHTQPCLLYWLDLLVAMVPVSWRECEWVSRMRSAVDWATQREKESFMQKYEQILMKCACNQTHTNKNTQGV